MQPCIDNGARRLRRRAVRRCRRHDPLLQPRAPLTSFAPRAATAQVARLRGALHVRRRSPAAIPRRAPAGDCRPSPSRGIHANVAGSRFIPASGSRPDDALHWTGRYQNWNACAPSAIPRICAKATTRDRHLRHHLERDQRGCQACHGPGANMSSGPRRRRRHVAERRTRAGRRFREGSSRYQVDQCARCHSRRQRVANEDRTAAPYSTTSCRRRCGPICITRTARSTARSTSMAPSSKARCMQPACDAPTATMPTRGAPKPRAMRFAPAATARGPIRVSRDCKRSTTIRRSTTSTPGSPVPRA